MNLNMRMIALAATAALAACADSEPPKMVDDDLVEQPARETTAPILAEDQPAIGEWTPSLQDEQPVLQFGPINTEPLFSLRCGESGGLALRRHGTIVTGGAQRMAITIADVTRELPVEQVGSAVPMLRAQVDAGDALIAAMGGDQPIRIAMGDAPLLVLPSSPAIGEFVARCSSAPSSAPADNPREGASS